MNVEQRLLFLVLCIAATPVVWVAEADSSAAKLIKRGFSATPDAAGSVSFQPLLDDPAGVFSLGFLRVNSAELDLAVVHVPSSLPLWRAIPAHPAPWAQATSLSFNGSLVLSASESGVVWSTGTSGDQLLLLNTSNLQIQTSAEPVSVLWQSFDFPSDTLVQGQNFTANATLVSSNQRFSGRMGTDFLGLYMEFGAGEPRPIYWMHRALEARAEIVPGEGSVYARVEPGGYLAMYQSSAKPVDVTSFNTFVRGIPGFLRMTLESDGNLLAYYWNSSAWVLDFTFITDPCGLPTVCGAYGVCSGGEPRCGCLDDSAGGCVSSNSGELPSGPVDLCAAEGGGFSVLRRTGVEMVGMDLQVGEQMGSLEDCEGSCAGNCTCWGAIYNNVTGVCYQLDYPIQTLDEADQRKLGYFKVPSTPGGKGGGGGKRTEVALLVVGLGILTAGAGYGGYLLWKRRRRARARVEGALSPGPYKDLGSSTFRSVELAGASSFRR